MWDTRGLLSLFFLCNEDTSDWSKFLNDSEPYSPKPLHGIQGLLFHQDSFCVSGWSESVVQQHNSPDDGTGHIFLPWLLVTCCEPGYCVAASLSSSNTFLWDMNIISGVWLPFCRVICSWCSVEHLHYEAHAHASLPFHSPLFLEHLSLL